MVKNLVLNYLWETAVWETDAGSRFEGETMDVEVYKDLITAIQTLPEECQLIFFMKLEGKSFREIAKELEITEENVISIQKDGWELLHRKLSGFMSLAVIKHFAV